MSEDTIFQTLVNILREHVNVTAPIGENSALLADGILDSLDFMNYLTRVEETFKLSISNEDLSEHKLGVMRNMVAYLAAKGL